MKPEFQDSLQNSIQNNLDETYLYIKQQLTRAAADVKHDLHRVYVSTFGSEYPELRTVVLRGVDWSKNEVTFHTDIRSNKYSELIANPNICILGYNHQKKFQIRLRGRVTLHHKNEVTDHHWKRLGVSSRRVYLALNPGRILNQAGNGIDELYNSDDLTLSATETGYDNFVCVTTSLHEMEWLLLARSGHRRALYKFTEDQTAPISAEWLCP